jgi:hypothetical protein
MVIEEIIDKILSPKVEVPFIIPESVDTIEIIEKIPIDTVEPIVKNKGIGSSCILGGGGSILNSSNFILLLILGDL